MFKNSTLTVLGLFSICLGAFSQVCTPEENLPDDFIGVFPPPFVEENPESGIKTPACINEEFDLTLSVFVPEQIEFGILTLGLEQITLMSVDGLPEGLSVVCNRTNCIYPAQEIDCIKVVGVPSNSNTPGDYEIFINMRARTNIFPNLEIQFPGIIAPGKYTLRLLEEGSEECQISTSVKPQIANLPFSVYPNPFQEVLNLQFKAGETGFASNEYQIELFETTGRMVYTERRNQIKQEEPITIPDHISPGIKILVIKDQGGNVLANTKVVKL
jgi:hypothetical protein